MPSDNTDVTLHSRLQAIFINRDEEIRDPATKQWAKARNSNIIEDLGRTSYVFSDKTGTLTSNEMRLRGIAVKQKAYGTMDFRLVVPPHSGRKQMTSPTCHVAHVSNAAAEVCAYTHTRRQMLCSELSCCVCAYQSNAGEVPCTESA